MNELKPRKAVDNIESFKPAKPIENIKREFGIDKILKLSANENTNGCSILVKNELIKALDEVYVYPDFRCSKIRELLADKYKLKLEQFVFGNGSFEIIDLIGQAFINPGDESIISEPSFGWYKVVTLKMDGIDINIPLRDHKVDLQEIKNKITDKTKIIWICNPNNPTGTIVKKKEVINFLESIPKDIIVVFDEAYYEFVTDLEYPETINLLNDYKNIIILRTFSKAYGLAGLRIGYGIADEYIINSLNKIRVPINVNGLAQIAAAAAFKDQKFKEKCVENNIKGKKYFYKIFNELKLQYIPTETNFIMVNIRKNSDEISNELLKKGISVRSGAEFNMPTWIRITIGKEEENKLLIKSLRYVLSD
ncbi:histidinol-phosphate aminotransferase [Clostridium algifaecis]|uniref:Histidinol-phosphate aminotransferase n=1 Tax=Clostridium algifaecis TaxID=1472040 RepID=A0ABS4KSD0_9CLOT|nr:histidinol-phosphate transaminase [Clostridium algifaecis]MBP2032932.1 histidinol-phosphate aminotransferase [Clostridium algifaecis]